MQPSAEDFPNIVEVVVEIPRGSRNKYEYDHDRGIIRLDRVLYSSMHYPTDYGFLPGTFELDLESGETRFRSVLVIHSDVGTRHVAQLLANALTTTQLYAPAFERIVRSRAGPLGAVDEIESA